MSRIVYVNGSYRQYHEAFVHVEDRGFQFADSVYEVIEVRGGKLVDAERHLTRLARSLRELGIQAPVSAQALPLIIRRVVQRNRVLNGMAYLQVSRGEAPRDFLFPGDDVAPTLVVIARGHSNVAADHAALSGISVQTMPDGRWARCDIKTVMLLPACLAKEEARRAGAQEAWFVDSEGYVTEGASSNAWIVIRENELVTRRLNQRILGGITRQAVFDLARAEGLTVVERSFTVDDVISAKEAFGTAATAKVMPVIAIDGRVVGDGRPGPIALRLRDLYSMPVMG